MSSIIYFAVKFFDLLDSLSLFFFTPVSQLASVVSSIFDGSVVLSFISRVITGLLVFAPFLAPLTLAELLLCGGIVFFLAVRLVSFLLPISD